MRHAEVSYVDDAGRPIRPEQVPLTETGRAQAVAAREALAGVELDLVVASDLPRTVETAELVAPGNEVERWPELAEWRGGRLDAIPPEELERAFVGALRIKDEAERFLGGESLGEALDRVHPALERLIAREWETALAVLHGGVNRIVISHALSGDRAYFGAFEQAPAASTSSTWATTAGSSAPSTTSRTTHSTPRGRRRWSTTGSSSGPT